MDVNITGYVKVINCTFLSNTNTNGAIIGGLSIIKDGPPTMQYVIIKGCNFHCNGYLDDVYPEDSYVLNIEDSSGLALIWDITISKTKFYNNNIPMRMVLEGQNKIRLTEVFVYNNTMSIINDANNGMVAITTGLYGHHNVSDTTLSIVSSIFNSNIGTALSVECASEQSATILINNSTFTNNINKYLYLHFSECNTC